MLNVNIFVYLLDEHIYVKHFVIFSFNHVVKIERNNHEDTKNTAVHI